jgi:lauroyl/myristoyl acyltransferase
MQGGQVNLQYFVNTRYGTGLGLSLGRVLPSRLGYAFAQILADLAATRRGAFWFQNLRANQWVAGGQRGSAADLDHAARSVLRHQARCLFDLYHSRRNPDALQVLAPPSNALDALIKRSHGEGEGVLLVIPHLSNFDLAFIANAYRGLSAQVLTFSQPSSGYRLQNRIRSVAGFEITPVSEKSSRQAVERMARGGVVITAVDRPIGSKKHTLNFFGHPSPLPAGHVRMAMTANVPIIAGATIMQPNGEYRLMLAEPIAMLPDPDPTEAIRQNAQAVLDVIAGYIRLAPTQWLMHYPVWPELLPQVPV